MSKKFTTKQVEYFKQRLEEMKREALNKLPEVNITAGQLREMGHELLPDEQVVYFEKSLPFYRASYVTSVNLPADAINSIMAERRAKVEAIERAAKAALDMLILGNSEADELFRYFNQSVSSVLEE